MDITTLKQLEDEFNKVYLLEDKGIIKLMVASVIANQLRYKPTWVMIIGASGSGKTAIVQTLFDLSFIFSISDLTVNTFASAQKNISGESSSLLYKMGPGSIMVFKDFTTFISKKWEVREQLMSQMREIYDGRYDRKTGNNNDVNWSGKIGAIAACTEVIYEHQEEFASMGDRFVFYKMESPNRRDATLRALRNTSDIVEKEEHLKQCMTSYITFLLENSDFISGDGKVDLGSDIENELIEVADFATNARSGVIKDFREKKVRFVPSKEMPMRMIEQLYAMAASFSIMNKTEGDRSRLSNLDMKILYKIAFDSIPIKRRFALNLLARYKFGATTKAVGSAIGYETEVVREWLSELAGLKICYRIKDGSSDKWIIKDEYRQIIAKHEHMEIINDELTDDFESDDERTEEIDRLRREMEDRKIDVDSMDDKDQLFENF